VKKGGASDILVAWLGQDRKVAGHCGQVGFVNAVLSGKGESVLWMRLNAAAEGHQRASFV